MVESMTMAIIELLQGNEINAISAFPNADFSRSDEGTVAVSIKKANIGSAGFGDYLGTSADGDETGFLCDATVSLVVYSPLSAGATGVNQKADKLIHALIFEQNSSLPKLSLGATEYDSSSRMLKQKCELTATFWIVKSEEAATEFSEFTVKGIISI